MNRKDLMVAGGVGLVLTLGWYQFVWQSQGKAETKAATEASAAKESVSKLTAQIAGLEKSKTDLEEKADLVARLDEAIPDSPQLSALVKQLQATAASRNVELTSISTGQLAPGSLSEAAAATATATPPSEMSMTLALHGSYPAVVEFVNDLNLMPRLVVVDAVTLNRNDVQQAGDGAVTNADVTATITAKVFSTALPPGPDGAPATTVPTTAAAGAAPTTAPGGL